MQSQERKARFLFSQLLVRNTYKYLNKLISDHASVVIAFDVECLYAVTILSDVSVDTVSSLLAHATDINDLLQGLDSVLKNGLDRLHDAKTALHVVNLRLHALNSLHLASNLDKGLAIVKSLQDAGGKGLLNVLDSGSLRNGGISVALGLRAQGRLQGA